MTRELRISISVVQVLPLAHAHCTLIKVAKAFCVSRNYRDQTKRGTTHSFWSSGAVSSSGTIHF